MSIDESVDKIDQTLSKVYDVNYEKQLYTSLISWFYNHGTDDLEVERIITALYNKHKYHNVQLGDLIKTIDDMYSHETSPNSGLDGIKVLVTKEFDEVLALEVVRELKLHLTPFDSHRNFSYNIRDNVDIVTNFEQKEVALRTTKFDSKGRDITEHTKVLTCYPLEIILHNNPLGNQGRKFTIQWITKYDEFFVTDNMLIPEMEQYLENHGYVLSHKYLKGVLPALIELFRQNKMVDVRNEIETAGFYYNHRTKQLDVIGYEVQKITPDDLLESLVCIEELALFFKDNEVKLATSLKHGLVAPFGFAKKQLNLPLEYLVPYMFHYGRGGSGKTTMARIPLYFYGEPDSESNDIGGSEFDTIARYGERISKFTFPLIINEPAVLFKKKSLKEALKSSVERVNARGRFEGKSYVNILALSTLIFTSNSALPVEEGTTRRYVQLLYSFDERKTDEEKEQFMDAFNLNSKEECRFHELKALGQFALNCIQSDMELLQKDWKQLSNIILQRAYDLCERTIPKWLIEFESVTLEQLDDEKTEDIRSFLLSEINREMDRIRYTLYDDGTGQSDFSDDVKGVEEFRTFVFDVINNHKIPYMFLKHMKDGRDYVCFTSNFKTVLNDKGYDCMNLKSLAEQLRWEYESTRINKEQSAMVMRVYFTDFLQFLYGLGDDE